MNVRGTPIPITIVTGYLGAGKTTLLNNLVAGDLGRRIAIVVNEFGAIGIDHDMVVNLEDEVYTLTNGCICCTIREDLIEIVEELLVRPELIDHIVIETTGLAEPGPVVMAFLNHPDIEERFRLDGIVTVVDARHVAGQFVSGHEARAQIAWADRILLNKIDLVVASERSFLEQHIREINPVAPIEATTFSATDLYDLLEIKGFEASSIEHDITIEVMRRAASQQSQLEVNLGDSLVKAPQSQHRKDIVSVAIQLPGAVNRVAFDAWIGTLLEHHHADIFRMKGVLNVDEIPRHLIVQSVHALYSWSFGGEWNDQPRENRLVFIGRNLDAPNLLHGFEECLTSIIGRSD